jgi:hypothetical protein
MLSVYCDDKNSNHQRKSVKTIKTSIRKVSPLTAFNAVAAENALVAALTKHIRSIL